MEKYCEKSAGKSVHLKVYSVQYTVYIIQSSIMYRVARTWTDITETVSSF